ncbi:PEP-CTERM sorting domain-containing protein [Aerosakkonemataceae cyanobacterium BLCC-F50]|uniref:PEP-CTERM sorting domain-containing protein n=1 Tax=Floridaenema flaviceps BLCC-F50 TaxID=3153642 RepID=A0ABV4XP64_9CYAN
MLIRHHLLIAITTMTLLGTATVTPAQAFTLSFQSTDGKVTGNIISQNDWQSNLNNTGSSSLSITGQGWSFSGPFNWLPGMQMGSQWSFRSTQGFGYVQPNPWYNYNPTDFIPFPYIEPVNNMPPGLPRTWFILSRTNTNPSISLFCHSDSDCLGDSGTITLNMSFRDYGMNRLYSWVGYSGQIRVTAWNPTGTSIPITPLPTNSVPEPSSALAFLLLGGGWLLGRKLAIN